MRRTDGGERGCSPDPRGGGERSRGGPGARRRGAAIALALGLALAGCSGDSTSGVPSAEVAAPAGSSTAGEDPLAERAPLQLTSVGPTETVVIAVRELPNDLDPAGKLDPWAQRIVDDLLFEALVRRAPDGYPWAEPALADRCEVEEGDRAVLCHVPDGRLFHDGAAVTMDDVVYSFEVWLGPRAARLRGSYGLDALKAAEVVDGPSGAEDPGRWIRITSDDADPLLLERLAAIKIVPKAKRRGRIQAFAKEPIGSGPMRLVTFDAEKMVFERAEGVDPERTGARRIVLRALP
ncbi:MAG: hypothetical protein KC486_20340, partial [Myxococcales bacterium]|nr:hypothetical protein [Myxococcales bacterium]